MMNHDLDPRVNWTTAGNRKVKKDFCSGLYPIAGLTIIICVCDVRPNLVVSQRNLSPAS